MSYDTNKSHILQKSILKLLTSAINFFRNFPGNITAAIVIKSYGEHLVHLVEKYNRVWASITPGARIKEDRRSMTPTSVLFVTISFIILMLISVLWLVIYYFQRFRYLQTKDKQSKHFYNVAKRIIAKIPTKKVKAEDVVSFYILFVCI